MMGFPVEFPGCFRQGGAGGPDHRQQLRQPGIQHGFRNTALPDRLNQIPGQVGAGGGHHQVGPGLHTGHMVIIAAPVRDHHAVKAPVEPEYILQKMGVFVGVGAVDLVVAGHDGLGATFFYGDLKAGKINCPQRPLVHHAVHAHAAQFLGIHRKVLGAGGHAVGLNAPDVGGGHFTC